MFNTRNGLLAEAHIDLTQFACGKPITYNYKVYEGTTIHEGIVVKPIGKDVPSIEYIVGNMF